MRIDGKLQRDAQLRFEDAGRKASGLSGDGIVQTLAAICEPPSVAKAPEPTGKSTPAHLSA